MVDNNEREAPEDKLAKLRRLNMAQGEALIALRHTVVCWPAKTAEEVKLFDCSELQIAKEDVEAVQRALKERDEARAELAAYHREDEKDSKARAADVAIFEVRIERLTKERDKALAEARLGKQTVLDEIRKAVPYTDDPGPSMEERLTKVLRNVLWVARGATDSPLEDTFGHALSNIEMRVEEALGIGPEDEVEHD